MNQYAEVITRIRESLEINKSDFAKLFDIDPALITRWENGENAPGRRHIPTLLNLAQPEEQLGLLRAVFGDDNFEVLAFEKDGKGGVGLVRVGQEPAAG